MDKRTNPFHDLYVSESIGYDSFVKLFSPFLVEHALPLFDRGNVVLLGVQGSGKSMLLNLLKPDTRIAYAQANIEYPVPKSFQNFISAGINLTRCGILDFGQRDSKSLSENGDDTIPIYFGDFLNYWVVNDIFSSIEKLCSNDKTRTDLRIDNNQHLLDEFANTIKKEDCWFGYLEEVRNYIELKKIMAQRIQCYRSYLNFNTNTLPQEVMTSKTSIGVPISQTVAMLKKLGIVTTGVNFFIRIDQYEELSRLDSIGPKLGNEYQQIINKALGLRDPNLSYRIGSRRFAWRKELRIYKSGAVVEEERNYKIVDIDGILRRKENRRTWIFPDFAKDVFNRRIFMTDFVLPPARTNLLQHVFGRKTDTSELAKQYAGSSPQRLLRVEEKWPRPWIKYLTKLVNSDPLSAKLAEGWCRQQGKESIMNEFTGEPPLPWEKTYWKKERVDQALMQIAARCGERLKWSGIEDVQSLSGGNILVFVSICQHIWAAWIRDMRGVEPEPALPSIEPDLQTVGIHEASLHWHNKISYENGGNDRKRFIDYIGTIFYQSLTEDKAMSYPGNNGFSLRVSELDGDKSLQQFLNDAVDYGDLHDGMHTTKTKDRELRRKWYLNPILSPVFRIPVAHTKEPIYCTVKDVRSWLSKSQLGELVDNKISKNKIEESPMQMQLFKSGTDQ
ncbi:MAG: hypothetical protein GJT30_07470 [Geobacter sp.]|nr:hypothetical protein [Geobacter sp.]